MSFLLFFVYKLLSAEKNQIFDQLIQGSRLNPQILKLNRASDLQSLLRSQDLNIKLGIEIIEPAVSQLLHSYLQLLKVFHPLHVMTLVYSEVVVFQMSDVVFQMSVMLEQMFFETQDVEFLKIWIQDVEFWEFLIQVVVTCSVLMKDEV